MLLISGLLLAGCETTTSTDLIRLDRAQGSEQNIASLSPPSSSRIRRIRKAITFAVQPMAARAISGVQLMTSNRAIQLNPRFFQAYANRALVYRNMGKPAEAVNDYNTALQINPNYDVALIGRGNIYRHAGRANEAFNDFDRAIQQDTTDGRAWHGRGLIYQMRGQHAQASKTSRKRSRCRQARQNPIMAVACPMWH